MTSVTRFFSLVLALALVSIPAVNAYAIPRTTVDYRRHDVNVRIVEETRSIPSVASDPRFVSRRRGVRDFRVPNRLRARQTLPQPELGGIPDVEPILPKEKRSYNRAHAIPDSSTVSAPNKVAPRDVTLPYPAAVPTLFPRNEAGLIELDLLNTYYQEMRTQSRNLRTCPVLARTLFLVDNLPPGDYGRRARESRDDPRFRDDTTRELRGFRDNMDRARGILGGLGRDKGLANYDRNNDLETLLKDLINLNKDVLSAVTAIVYEIPVLGPLLGPGKCPHISIGVPADSSPRTPVVYEIKCIIDEVLNAIENTVDGLLNTLGITAQWRGVRGDYVNELCGGGLQILGLCVGADTNLLGLGLRSDDNR